MKYVRKTYALTKRYRHFTALRNLEMHLPKRSIYGFVGRNSAGKTTLIRLICGLQEPSSGSFTMYGVPNADPKIARRLTESMGGTISVQYEACQLRICVRFSQ